MEMSRVEQAIDKATFFIYCDIKDSQFRLEFGFAQRKTNKWVARASRWPTRERNWKVEFTGLCKMHNWDTIQLESGNMPRTGVTHWGRRDE